ncbi:MAG: hypothetical protein WCG08_15395 [Paludibacter sp.]
MIEILKEFLEFPLWNTDGIFNKFRWLEETEGRTVVFQENKNNPKERFLYIEGIRTDKVVLVAHADTVWDKCYNNRELQQKIVCKGDYLKGTNPDCGIGADDRAGCAMLWLLRNSGHSILITDGEDKKFFTMEPGMLGSKWLKKYHTDILEQLNSHRFMIQLDKRDATDFKCYSVGTPEFKEYIHFHTSYNHVEGTQKTDIVELCTDICGVNFSIGYSDEHTHYERINTSEWLHTLEMLKTLLNKQDLTRFKL